MFLFFIPFINFKQTIAVASRAWPFLPAFIIPLLSVTGVYVMETKGSNIILLSMLISIPIYVLLLTFFKQKIAPSAYPLGIFGVSLALLLTAGLTSDYFCGKDIYLEYQGLRTTLDNMHWSMDNYSASYNACLPTSLLAAVYTKIMGINGLYVYKLLYPIIASFLPVIVYVISKKYIGSYYAFLASFLFIAQLDFANLFPFCIRREFGFLFFGLFIMVLFTDNINQLTKRVLLLTFMLSCIVSYYTGSYLFWFLLFSTWLVIAVGQRVSLSRTLFRFGPQNSMKASTIIICGGLIFLWWSQITNAHFTNLLEFIEQSIRSFAETASMEAREGGSIQKVLWVDLANIPDKILAIVNYLQFFLVGIGVITIVFKTALRRAQFETEYTVMACISLLIVGSLLVLPSWGYAYTSLYQQFLILLAPMFIIGAQTIISRFLPKILKPIPVVLIISLLLLCSNYFVHQASGITQGVGFPKGVYLIREGDSYNEFWVHEEEVAGSEWFARHKGNVDHYNIFGDWPTHLSRLMLGSISVEPRGNDETNLYRQNLTGGYVFLRWANIIENKISASSATLYTDVQSLTDYPELLKDRAKVYDAGSTQVWK